MAEVLLKRFEDYLSQNIAVHRVLNNFAVTIDNRFIARIDSKSQVKVGGENAIKARVNLYEKKTFNEKQSKASRKNRNLFSATKVYLAN